MSHVLDGSCCPRQRHSLVRYLLVALTAAVVVLSGIALTGCSSSSKQDPFAGQGSPRYPGSGPLPKGGGRQHVGQPYTIAGQKFYPREDPSYDRTGMASWYGPKFHRRMTSNGEWFDMEYLSAAHPTLPLPSYAKVTNLENNRTLVVRLNDRGPFVANRIIDLSRRAADELGFKNRGTAKVRVQYVGPAPLNDQGQHLAAMNDELRRGTPLRQMIASADARSGERTVVASSGSARSAPAARPVAESGQGRAASRASGYYIQAAAFADPDNASKARSRLSRVGPVEVSPLEVGAQTLFRVRVGPLSDQSKATLALQEVIAAGHNDARIIAAAD